MSLEDRPLRWGVASLVEQPMPELASRAREYETLGFDDVWVPDERLLRNVYVSLATIANATTRIGLGPAVTNPYTRHPAHTAAAIATIDELSGGRATLAYGAGGGLDAYGVKRTNPVRTLREAVQIAHMLFQGETVTYEGEAFALRATQLDFAPLRPIPVYLAARGPKILQLAGEVADGAIIGGFAEPGGLKYALDMVGRGIERAGRRAADVDIMSWLYVSVDDDPAAARTAVSKIVLASLITSRPILDRIGIKLPTSLRDHLDARGWRYPTKTPEEAARLLPDHIVDAFAVHGTPESVRERLRVIHACGIDHVSFVLFPVAGTSTAGLARRIAQDVVSPLSRG
ncbi:LLM class flavin-dependent oxidoreductase [Phytohabitans flavus]|nr:LLM class flavin-dependent oxidoreductase [Phytohabitans flavus]